MGPDTQVRLQSLAPYRHLFPRALVVDKTVKKKAGVSDTIRFIPKVVQQCRWQVTRFVDKELRGLSRYKQCEKLWHWVKYHIQYEKDGVDENGKPLKPDGLEWVRSPRRLVHDGKGDCDCFTTFIDCCMDELGVKGIINRITEYDHKGFFQHVYPLIPDGNGGYIIMDCVASQFNYEVPYTDKEDHNMELQFLDGLDEEDINLKGIDAQDLAGSDDLLGLGRLFKRKAAANKAAGGGGKKKLGARIKAGVKKVVHAANRVNPGVALLRAGILASMKLNIMKVGENLRWAYLPEDQARAKGADMGRYNRMKQALQKLEKVFYSAGGKPENLKKAILSGRGNRDKGVNGLGALDSLSGQMEGIDEATPVGTLLGADLYHSEMVEGIEGLGQLGEPATGAAVAAATTVITAIAAVIKGIGNVMPNKKKKGAEESASETGGEEDSGGEASEPEAEAPADEPAAEESTEDAPQESADENLPAETGDEGGTTEGLSGVGDKVKAFWTKHKRWMIPTGITAGVLTVAAIALIKKNKKKGKKTAGGLNGPPRGKRKKRAKRYKQISPVSLM